MLNISTHLPHTHRSVLEISQALPGYLLANGDFNTARAVLLQLVDYAGSGLIPYTTTKYKPPADAATNFWFIHAAYAYAQASNDVASWRNVLLPMAKRIAQSVIIDGLGDVTMTDAGMVVRGPVESECYPMALNALWYMTLAMLTEELPKADIPGADHFSRLAARFRRSFGRVFLCGRHGCLCEPRVQHSAGHEKSTYVPDPEQLLFIILPFSPLAGTKQKQIVDSLKTANVSDLGMRVPWTLNVEIIDRNRPGRKPEIVSPLCLAWLAEALLKVRNASADAVQQAQIWMTSLAAFEEEHDGNLAWLYELRSQQPAGHRPIIHGPTVAEISRVKRLVAGLRKS